MSHVHTNANLPTWLCIGAQKAGTSWLYQQLRQHPQLWLPPVKELHFFDYLFVPEVREWAAWHIRKEIAKKLKRHITESNEKDINLEYIYYLSSICSKDMFTLPWYKMIYAYPGAKLKVCGDITPEYCMLNSEGISYLLHCLRNVKIIYIIRDATQRALSHLRMLAETENFSSETEEKRWLALAKSSTIMAKSDYIRHISLYDKLVGTNNILYMPFGMIKNEPKKFLSIIEQFLCIASHAYGDAVHTPVWASKKFDLPESVIDYMHNTMRPQSEFLRLRFGKNFFGNC
jgi:hypothetical protein